jgi:3-dehydroquinate synthase
MNSSPIFLDTKPVSYVIGEGALEYSQKLLKSYPRIIVLVDENTDEHCLPVFRERLSEIDISHIITIESGEEKKNLEQSVSIWNELTQARVDRDALLINLGGGVVTDIGGFAAATFKRGIRFVNYPTTLLGMVDAAIGGKTGIDFGNFKNQVGLFADPDMVVIDPVFLMTLDEKQWQSGFAEVLKYGLIMDKELWRWIYGQHFRDVEDWNKIITRAARDKIDIVRHDFKEKGIRKNLNFGHTIGHAFESYFLNSGNAITHGQAIAAGMICEGWLSVKCCDLEWNDVEQIVHMFDINFERLPIEASLFPTFMQIMQQDKKARGGHLNYSLLRRIGKALHNIEVEKDLVVRSLNFYIES